MKIQKNPFQNIHSPVVFIESARTDVQRLNFSALGFLYRKNPDGTYLLATCAHIFWEEFFPVAPNSMLAITKDYNMGMDPSNFLPFAILEGPLFSKKIHSDIAILKVTPKRQPKEEFKLLEPADFKTLTGKEIVSLVQSDNDSGQTLITQEGFFMYPEQKYSLREDNSIVLRDGHPGISNLLRIGACPYRCFGIYSEPGASGSPVWIDENKLLGINLGGVTDSWTAIVVCPQIDAVIEELSL